MLTYGTAVAEIVPTIGGDDIGALYVADLDNIDLMHDDKTLSVDIYVKDSFGEKKADSISGFDFNDSAESASWQCTWCFYFKRFAVCQRGTSKNLQIYWYELGQSR